MYRRYTADWMTYAKFMQIAAYLIKVALSDTLFDSAVSIIKKIYSHKPFNYNMNMIQNLRLFIILYKEHKN